MVNEKIFNVFFRAKPAMLLLNLKNAKSDVYASTVAKGIDCTYSHVVKILQEMEKGNHLLNIGLDDVQSGVYNLVIKVNEEVINKKLIKID